MCLCLLYAHRTIFRDLKWLFLKNIFNIYSYGDQISGASHLPFSSCAFSLCTKFYPFNILYSNSSTFFLSDHFYFLFYIFTEQFLVFNKLLNKKAPISKWKQNPRPYRCLWWLHLSKQHIYMFSFKMLTKFLWWICFFKYQEHYRVNAVLRTI